MRKILYLLAILSFLFGSFFIYKGFDKKMNYREPRYSSNAYVGGDAYNYIINSNYFTGYNVLGIGCYVISVISLTGAAILQTLDEKHEQAKQFYDYIREHPMFSSSGKKAEKNAKQKGYGFSADEWGQFPDFSSENENRSNTSQATNTNTPESPQSQVNFNSYPNCYQTQNSQYYSYPSRQNSTEPMPRPYSQNPVSNPPIPYFNYEQNPGNISSQNSQNDNYSGSQGNNKNMP